MELLLLLIAIMVAFGFGFSFVGWSLIILCGLGFILTLAYG